MQIQTDIDLRPYNTFGFAVTARRYLALRDTQTWLDWWSAPEQSALRTQPRFILGGGSNLVLTHDVQTLVLHLQTQGRQETRRDEQSVWFEVQAGEVWHDWVMWTVAQGYAGIENLSLIPGTVGAAPVQNIGAYGMEVRQAIEYVRAYDFATDTVAVLSRDECAFGYRDSIFKHVTHEGQARYLILAVGFKLRHQLDDWQATLGYGDVAQRVSEQAQGRVDTTITPADVASAIIAIRQSKLPNPKIIGNAGSFFKNPLVTTTVATALKTQFPNLPTYPVANGQVKLAAGWLIEQAGWKGVRDKVFAIGVYDKQALVLVNHGGATGAQLMAFAEKIVADVQDKFGVAIEPEPIVV